MNKSRIIRKKKTAQEPTALILIASPGGGKSTTFEGLVRNGYAVQTLDFRTVLDEEERKKTPTGRKIKAARRGGRLVSAEIMKRCVREAFRRVDHNKGLLILDGLPRDRSQIDLALSGLEKSGFTRKIVLYLECNHIIAACRIILRGRNKMDRDPVLVAKRIAEFEGITMSVVKDFREHHQRYGVEFIHYNTNNLKGEFRNLLRILVL